jgi:PAS domain S-box-containing protein
MRWPCRRHWPRTDRVLAVNLAYRSPYGFTPEQVIGKTFAVIFPEHQREAAERAYRDLFRGGIVPLHEARGRRADDAELIVEARAVFVEQDGRRVAMLPTIRNVTALRQAGAERDAHQFRIA